MRDGGEKNHKGRGVREHFVLEQRWRGIGRKIAKEAKESVAIWEKGEACTQNLCLFDAGSVCTGA